MFFRFSDHFLFNYDSDFETLFAKNLVNIRFAEIKGCRGFDANLFVCLFHFVYG